MIAFRALLLALPLKKGVIKASDELLESAISIFEKITLFFGAGVFVGVSAEVWLAWRRFPDAITIGHWGPVFADILVAVGVGGEIWFAFRASRCSGELTRRSKDRLAEAEKKGETAQAMAACAQWAAEDAQSELVDAKDRLAVAEGRAGEAIERAAKADLARAELEAKLLPRMLNQDQWDFIQGLRGKFSEVSIAYETDAETRWYADNVRGAFMSAGMRVGMVARAADVHSFGTLIFEPKGFDGARPTSVEPLVEIFRMADVPVACAVITGIPTDVLSAIANERPEMRPALDAPMVILGGRFVIPPPQIEKAAKAAKAAMDAARNK